MNSGLQIWGLNTDSFQYNFNYNNFAAANMNGVMWSFEQSNPGVLSAGQKWGKWVQPNPAQSNYTAPSSSLNATENAHYADLLAIQVGDEQQSDLENPSGYTKAWFDAAHSGGNFADKLLYVNSAYISDTNAYINFVAGANPDAISWDSYPFGTTGVYPYNWLGKAQIFRRVALGSYIGATGTAARPYGLYLQTYHGGDGARDPGDLEMRWQQFTAWTLGYTFVDGFTAGGGNTSLFNSGDGNSPHQPIYNQFKETSRQSRNLGPALTKLISYGYGPSVVLGKDASGATNAVPIDWLTFNKTNAPANQQFLTNISAQNLGTKNGGNPGDVYVGFFNPLLTSYGDPAGTAYFMLTNALGAYLQDPTLLVSDCTQRLTADFDFTGSNITSLQRLNRNTGQVEVVPLTRVTGNQFRLTYDLEGGTGDLYKFNDGTPFVGVQAPAVAMYWDNDNTAGNNNLTTGSGLGGSGTWDSPNKWYNGASNGLWAANNSAVFWGTGGTVTLSASQSANSLSFKSNGYTVMGATLMLTGPSVSVDSGVTATISAPVGGIVGLVKNGVGTLLLSNISNSYTGGTTINAGTLQISSDSNLGLDPGSFATGNVTLNGGTLRFGANFDIANNRGITLGVDGGTIDTQGFSNISGYNATAGGFSGPGDLTKLGSGTFFAAATSGGLNTTWKGKLILKEGVWKIVASDGLPYNAPLADGLQPAQVTFDGGTLQMGATINVTSARRGITVAAGGGTIDTQSFNFTWAGPLNGTGSAVAFNKIGSGQLQFNTPTTTLGNFSGTMNVNGGAVVLSGGGAMGDLASINMANVAGASLSITGAETIGSLSGGGTSGGNVSFSSTLNAGGNNSSTTLSSLLSGSGALTKSGAGTFTLARASGNTYSGGTTVSGGTLLVNNTTGSGTGTNSVVVNSGATLGGTGKITGAVTVNSGGHLSPGAGGIESLDVASVSLAAGSVLDMDLATIAGVDTSDLLNVTGTNGLAISGITLNIANVGGMTGGFYTLIDYVGTFNGSMSNIALGTVPSGFSYSLIHDTTSTSIQLEVTAPGDFDHDGTVDGGDYVVWRKGVGTKYTDSDYDTWLAHYGQTYTPGAGAELSAVPEPRVGVLLGVGVPVVMIGIRFPWRR